MTVTAALTVVPMDAEDADAAIAAAVDALEDFDVEYETHPMETTIEAESSETVFAAAHAAHSAASGDRVYTSLSVDDAREKTWTADDKVDVVREKLGRDPRSD